MAPEKKKKKKREGRRKKPPITLAKEFSWIELVKN